MSSRQAWAIFKKINVLLAGLYVEDVDAWTLGLQSELGITGSIILLDKSGGGVGWEGVLSSNDYISVRHTITIPKNHESTTLVLDSKLSWLKRFSVSKVCAVQA